MSSDGIASGTLQKLHPGHCAAEQPSEIPILYGTAWRKRGSSGIGHDEDTAFLGRDDAPFWNLKVLDDISFGGAGNDGDCHSRSSYFCSLFFPVLTGRALFSRSSGKDGEEQRAEIAELSELEQKPSTWEDHVASIVSNSMCRNPSSVCDAIQPGRTTWHNVASIVSMCHP